jgi:hypothetical protein
MGMAVVLLACEQAESPRTATSVASRPDAAMLDASAALDASAGDAALADAALADAALSTRDAAAAVADARSTPRARGPLIEASSWEVLAAADDPFSDRMPGASCPEEAHMPELLANEEVFSVDTAGCSYITARQSALRAVDPGELLRARVWHFALYSNDEESVSAHVALRVGDSTLLDQEVPIPSEGGLIAIEVEAPAAFPVGTPVFFHLHNHGDNSWSLVELSAGPKP